CEIVTKYCKRDNLESLARRIRPRLRGLKSNIVHVDIKDLIQETSLVIPYEKEINKRPFVSNNDIIFDDMEPYYMEYLPSSAAWICDLVKDTVTGRLPFELCLPHIEYIHQVINAPAAPYLHFRIDDFCYGIDSLNVRFTKDNPQKRLRVPCPEEFFTEMFFELGIKLVKDEKRIRYNQTIDMLGGLSEAAMFFSGISLDILKSFKSEPITYGQIKGNIKSGGNIPIDIPFIQWIDRLPIHRRRIGKQRYKEYLKENLSKYASVQEVIEKLIDRGALRLKWKLNKCTYCDKEYWVNDIKINSPIYCPGCNKKIILRNKVELGYELNELVKLSIKEGIIPVILTARFLKNLTSSGFFWLPGIKCISEFGKHDLDIIACCDGHLICAECKTLDDTKEESKTWEKIANQIIKQIKLIKTLRIETFVIAALCDKFPDHFKNKISEITGKSIGILFLTKKDLLEGIRRKTSKDEPSGLTRIIDILPFQVPIKKKKKKKKGKRFVSF
ncbi:hypothetical protein ACFL5B_03165, partial [Candidatus Latescibacterota bacterium]